MKKALIALALIMTFATTSFASVSFLTAPSVGQGKIAVLGIYATNHGGGGINNGGNDPSFFDTTSLGLRVAYGILPDLDVLAAYSADTFTRLSKIADVGATQKGANTVGLGAKYTVVKESSSVPVDIAVLVGFESSLAKLSLKSGIGDTDLGQSSIGLAGIVSKKIDNLIPYGGIAIKSLQMFPGKAYGAKIDPIAGTGIMFNMGLLVGIAEDQAVAIEYNMENQAYGETTFPGGAKADDPSTQTVSGISIGYCYLF